MPTILQRITHTNAANILSIESRGGMKASLLDHLERRTLFYSGFLWMKQERRVQENRVCLRVGALRSRHSPGRAHRLLLGETRKGGRTQGGEGEHRALRSGPGLAQFLGAPVSNLCSPWLERSANSPARPVLWGRGDEVTPGTQGQFAEEAPSQDL